MVKRNSLKENVMELWEVDEKYPLTVSYPDNIMFEVTNACNLKCAMCYNRKMQRKKGFMSEQLYNKVIKEASELGIRNVGLFTTGEAFLHPRIFDFIRSAKDRDIKYVYITTNGVLLDEEKIGKIFDSGLDSIKFSIDAASKETYEKEREGGDWDKLLSIIEKLRNLRDKRKSRLNIFGSFVITESNIGELRQYMSVFKDLLDETYYCFVANQGGLQSEVNDSKIPPAVRNKINELILTKEKQHPCNLLWNRFIVTYDGKLTICCVDFEAELVYGDLIKQSLKECWNNPEMRNFRKIHREKNFALLPMCPGCDVIRTNYNKQDEIVEELVNLEKNIAEV